jgi:hypothetical protein
VTGLFEFALAILLLIPLLSGIGALLAIPIMIGAILTHLLVIGGSPALRQRDRRPRETKNVSSAPTSLMQRAINFKRRKDVAEAPL